MKILVATDGTLPVDRTVEHVQRLWRDGDAVMVLTIVHLPRTLLRQLDAIATTKGGSIQEIVDAAGPGMGMGGGDRVAERLAPPTGRSASTEPVLERYRAEVARQSTAPIVDALSAAGITATPLVREVQERTAATIMDICRSQAVDLLLIGSTGRGRFEGRLGSTGTKLVRNPTTDVLVIRVPPTS